jgi:transposase
MAVINLDRFHVIQLAGEAMDAVRKAPAARRKI